MEKEATLIDLGHKMEMPTMAEKNESQDVQYPSFYYRGEKKLELPESGTMEIQFSVRSKTETKHDGGPTYYEYCIEVRGIEEVESDEPEAPTKRRVDAEEALDRLAEERSKRRK